MIAANAQGTGFPVSFEFFPPKTPEGADKLRAARQQLYALHPDFCSVTYGAGGSTQEGTFGTVREILAEGVSAASHFSCIGATRQSVREQLATPKAMGANPEVHPQAKSPEADLNAYIAKVQAGADSAITQYFYNSDAYFRFVEDTQRLGANVPVVPGIMPIGSSTQLMRFSDACGAEIPRWIRLRLQAFGDDTASIKAFGLDVVTDLCDQLRSAGVPALHFYTMNQSAATLEICRRLGI